jgi:hypothetical protein
MFNNVIPNSIPFYEFQAALNFKRPNVSLGERDLYKNLVPWDELAETIYLPKLNIKRATVAGSVTSFKLLRVNDTFTAFSDMKTLPNGDWSGFDLLFPDTPGFQALVRTGGNLSVASPAIPLNQNTPYLLRVVANGVSYYSEVFYLSPKDTTNPVFPSPCNDGSGWIRLYWTTATKDQIAYTFSQEGGAWSIMLNAVLGGAEYGGQDDQKEGGTGDKTSSFVRLYKRFQFFVLVPEYVADCLCTLPLFPDANIEFVDGSQMDIREIEVDAKAETDSLYRVTVSFIAPNAYNFKRTGC